MMSVESSALFRSPLDALLDKESAASGIVLEPAERRAFRLSVITIEADAEDGNAHQYNNTCASKGCTVVKGKKKAKKAKEAKEAIEI